MLIVMVFQIVRSLLEMGNERLNIGLLISLSILSMCPSNEAVPTGLIHKIFNIEKWFRKVYLNFWNVTSILC